MWYDHGMLLQILLFLVGSYFFLFVFWKRLKEDYFGNHIFSTGFYLIISSALIAVLSLRFLPEYWFWLLFIGNLVSLRIAATKYKLRFFEILEAYVMSSFLPLIMILVYDGVSKRTPTSFFAIIAIALFIGLFYLLSVKYKTFTWYKSGRVGFTGVAIISLFFLTRAIVAIWFPAVLSFVDAEVVVSSIFTGLSVITLGVLAFKT